MHNLSLYEIDCSYYQVVGRWEAQDDFRPTGYSTNRRTETLLIVAPSQELAVAAALRPTAFSKEQDYTIDEVRCCSLHCLITQEW